MSPQARAAEVCGFPVVPLYRAASASLHDRIFSTNPEEIEVALASGQYIHEAVIASVYSNTTGPDVPNAIPLYKLHSVEKNGSFHHDLVGRGAVRRERQWVLVPGHHRIRVPSRSGWVRGDGRPLYRQYNPKIQDHQYSTAKPTSTPITGDANGYFYEGITGYVFAPQ